MSGSQGLASRLGRAVGLGLCGGLILVVGACGRGGSGPDAEHADEHARAGAGGSHEHDEHAEHDEHDEDLVRLTDEQLERAGVRIEALGGGTIGTSLTLPGEIGLNEDTVVHVTPRVPGVVSSVHGFLGRRVAGGALLAVLQSPQLGEAKITYLQALHARAIADAELERQRTISQNTATLLDLLRQEPSSDELRARTADLRIGENKGRLLSAYARLQAARANHEREQQLRAGSLSTAADLLAAQEAFDSSQAEYLAAFEEIDFTFRVRLEEAERAAGVAASAADNAERRLHLLGLSQEQVAGVADEADTLVARYELSAPMGGWIVFKHVTPGEMVGTDEPIYTIADLSTVWLNVSVHAQHAASIAEGQRVVARAGARTALGVVEFVGAVVSESTRTVTARVVLDNAELAWRPGELVTVRLEIESSAVARAVPLDAVQTFEGRDVVFVRDDEGIRPVAVVLGRRDDRLVELVGQDVPLGTPVVVANSFLIKAELGRSSAGHDH